MFRVFDKASEGDKVFLSQFRKERRDAKLPKIESVKGKTKQTRRK